MKEAKNKKYIYCHVLLVVISEYIIENITQLDSHRTKYKCSNIYIK